MPELPEVETTLRGIRPLVEGRRVTGVVVRNRHLRWPVPAALSRELPGQFVRAVRRRAKYLLLETPAGTVLLHLGMSGSLRVVPADTPPARHDHVDLVFAGGVALRLRDPRRFGTVLWTRGDPQQDRLLRDLGPEPFSTLFDGGYLYGRSRRRTAPVKSFIMDSRIVVGVGNIYASEALFRAGIRPRRPAGRVGLERYGRLARAIREVLAAAIRRGGTTLADFTGSDGKPGYFRPHLRVYGRAGEPCRSCGTPLKSARVAQRSTFYCACCQR